MSQDNIMDRVILGLRFNDMENGHQDQTYLKVAEGREKIYANKYLMHTKLCVKDHVFFIVRPKKMSMKLKSCAKLATKDYRPFEVL